MSILSTKRVFFIGARLVAFRCLKHLLSQNIQLVGCLFLDDKLQSSTVAHCSELSDLLPHHIPYQYFTNLKDAKSLAFISSIAFDIGVIIGVSFLLPTEFLRLPSVGFIGMHPTLLPVGRGRAPIPWAIIKGLTETGVSLFWCHPDADKGPLICQETVPIHFEDTSSSLGSRTDFVAARMLSELFSRDNQLSYSTLQDSTKATYWSKRSPSDGCINWSLSSLQIYNFIRALTHPYPGAFTFLNQEKFLIWSSRLSNDLRVSPPGYIIDIYPHGILVGTGSGSLLLTCLEHNDLTITKFSSITIDGFFG